MIKSFKKTHGGFKFMTAMLAIYAVLVIIDLGKTVTVFQDFIHTLLSVLPFLVLVFFIIFIINLVLKPETIQKHLGENAGLKGWLYAVIGSMLITSPPYVTFPLLGELKKHGMKYKFIGVFLNSRNIQLSFLPVMAHYFGWLFTAIISSYVLIYAIISGLILEKLMRRN